MIVNYVEFVQETQVRVGNVCNEQVLLVGKERVELLTRSGGFLVLLLFCLVFAGEVGQNPNEEADTPLLDELVLRRY